MPSSRTNRLLATYFISALWHGIYPGYYICFFGAAFVTVGLDNFFKKLPGRGGLFENNATAIEFMCKLLKWLVVFLCMDFIVLGLLFLSIEHSYVAQRAFGFYAYALVVGLFVVFSFVPGRRSKRKAA